MNTGCFREPKRLPPLGRKWGPEWSEAAREFVGKIARPITAWIRCGGTVQDALARRQLVFTRRVIFGWTFYAIASELSVSIQRVRMIYQEILPAWCRYAASVRPDLYVTFIGA